MMFQQLIKKEYMLQRPVIYFALTIMILWCALFFLAPQAQRALTPRGITWGELIVYMHWGMIVPCLLLITPLFLGANMVAEERRLGVWDWHLSLPYSRK